MEESKLLRPAVFLDRDGVINEDIGYLYRPQDLLFCPGAPEALSRLKAAGFLLLVVSNQSGIARGYFTVADVEKLHHHMQQRLVAQAKVSIDAFYFCPYHPQGKVAKYALASDWRKPEVGMLRQACQEFLIDLSRSFLVGDKPSDIDCAIKFNLKAIQTLASGHPKHPKADHWCQGLFAATNYILRHS